jgi:hypothetical protein
MEKNLFCYVLEKDIPEESKASEDNNNCTSCAYFKVCERDLSGKAVVLYVEKAVKAVKEVKEKAVKAVKEKVVKETVVKEKKEKVVKEKKVKKGKTSLEELSQMNAEDIF